MPSDAVAPVMIAPSSAIIRDPLTASPETPVMEAIAQMSDAYGQGDRPGLETSAEGAIASENGTMADSWVTDGSIDTVPEPMSLVSGGVRSMLASAMRSSCIVIVEAGQIVGILTERDVVCLSARHPRLDELVLRQVMTSIIVTLRESEFTDVLAASALLQRYRVRHLPILNDQGYLTGVVTQDSLHQAITQQQRQAELAQRRQVEGRLQESEQRFASLAAAAPVGIFRADAFGQCAYVNERYCHITGFSLEASIGQGWQVGLHAEDRERVIAEWERSVQTQQPFQVECRYHRPDGEVRWVYAQSVVERDGDGRVVGYVGTLTDITESKQLEAERRQAEAALIQSEAKSRALLEALPDCMLRIGADGIYREVVTNKPEINLLPPTPDPVGLSIEDTLPSDFVKRHKHYRDRVLLTGELQVYEQQVQMGDRLQYEEVRMVKSGEDEILIMIRDISEQKRLEAEREQANIALRASEQRFRHLFEATPRIAVQGYDRHRRVIYWNRASEQLYGYTEAEAVGRQLEDLIIPTEMRRQVIQDVAAWLTEGQKIAPSELLLERKDGSKVPVFSSHIMLTNTEGEPEMYCVDIDLSDRKHTEVALDNLVAGTAATTGQQFFPALVQHIADALQVSHVLVNERMDHQMQNLAFWANSALQPAFMYDLNQTPCGLTVRDGRFYCESAVYNQFPDNPDLAEMGVESYLGVVLVNAEDQVLGSLCILDPHPIQNPERAEQILRIFAARATAEIERQRASALLEQLNHDLETKVEERTAALQRGESQIRAMIEAIPDLLVRVTRDGSCVNVVQPRSGASDFLSIPQHLSDVLPESLLSKQLERVEEAIATGTLQVYEHHFQKHDQIAYEEIRISAISDDEALIIVRDVSDRKRTQVALQDSQQFIQTILDTIPLPVFWKDRNSVFLGCNSLFVEAMGVERAAELIGKTDFDFDATREQAAHYQADDRWVMEAGQAKLGIEEPLTGPDGKRRWLETHKAPLRDVSGAIVGMVGAFQDITDRKRDVAELRASRAYYRGILADQTELICRFLPDGTLTFVNEAYCQYFQKTPKELIGRSFTPLIPEEDKRDAAENFSMLCREYPVATCEHRVIKPDGTIAWQQWTDRALFDPDGNFLEFQSVGRDISALKSVEAALRESEARWQFALEGAGDGVWDWNLETNDEFFSPQLKAMLGYADDEMANRSDEWDCRVHPEDQERVDHHLHQHFRGETPTYQLEYRLRCKDGSYKWILDRGKVIEWAAEGQPTRVIGTCTDISDRKQAESNLRELSDRLNLAVEAADIGIWDWDISRNTLHWDARMCALYGLKIEQFEQWCERSETVYESWIQCVHPDDRTVTEEAVKQALQGSQDYDIEFRVTHPEGAIRFTKAKALVQRNAQGEAQRMIGINYDITDIKEAEAAMKQQLAAIETATDGMAILRDDRFLYVNQSKLDILGYGHSEELLGESWRILYGPEMLRQYEQEILPALNRDRVWQGEVVANRKDGSSFIEELSLTLTDDNLLICVCRDISDRKAAERMLNLTQSAVDLAAEGVFLMHSNGRFYYVNEAASTMSGYSREEMLTLSICDLDVGLSVEDWQGQWQEVKQRRSITVESWHQSRNGRLYPVESSINYLELDGEEYVFAFVKDISERKQSEAQIRSLLNRTQLLNRINAEIRKSLDLDNILQNLVNAIAAKLPADICTFAWYQADDQSTLWTIVKEQKSPELPSWIGCHQLDVFPNLSEHIIQNTIYRVDHLRCLNSPEDQPLKQFFEDMGICSYLCVPIHTSGGKIGSLQIGRIFAEQSWQRQEVKLLQDIANQVAIAIYQAELYEDSQAKTRELQQSYQDLKDTQLQLVQSEKMSSLGQLVAGIAHEINNPISFIYGNLTPAFGYAEKLEQLIRYYQEAYPNPSAAIANFIQRYEIEYILDDFPKLLESMENGANRIHEIVQSLRTFSRLDRAECKAVDLHQNIDSTLVILQNRLNGRAGNPEIEVIKNYGILPCLECYGSLLNQVFMNLLSNAIDAIEERQSEGISDSPGRITITTSILHDDRVSISICDNGIGMNVETQSNIFNPFFTTKPVGVGTGMGLPISYQIVNGNHRGQLRFVSTPGEGTEFIIELWQYLPQVESEEVDAPDSP